MAFALETAVGTKKKYDSQQKPTWGGVGAWLPGAQNNWNQNSQTSQQTTPTNVLNNGTGAQSTGGGTGGTGANNSYSTTAAQAAAQKAAVDALMAQMEGQYSNTQTSLDQYKNNSAAEAAQRLAAQQQQEQEARKQMAASQETAYNENVSTTNAKYVDILAALENSYNQQVGTIQSGYDINSDAVNQRAAQSLQEAYVAQQLAQRNIGQQLAANGRSGGAAESTMLSLANSYGNNRGTLERERNANLATLGQQLQENLAGAQSGYAQQQNDYNANLASELASYKNAYTDYLANWDAQSLQRQQSFQSDYDTNIASINQYVQQQLLAAQQSLNSQRANLLANLY